MRMYPYARQYPRLAVLVLGLAATAAPVIADQVRPQRGDLLVADQGVDALYAVRPDNTIRGIVTGLDIAASDLSTSPATLVTRGDGPRFDPGYGMVVLPTGEILVGAPLEDLLLIDPATGDRSPFESNVGPVSSSASSILGLADGTIILTEGVVLDFPPFDPDPLAVYDGWRAIRFFAYDPATGALSLLSDPFTHDGPLISQGSVLVEHDGRLFASEFFVDGAIGTTRGTGLFEIDRSTGERRFVTGYTSVAFQRPMSAAGGIDSITTRQPHPSGPYSRIGGGRGVIGLDGSFYISTEVLSPDIGGFESGLLRVDPDTLDRQLVLGRAQDAAGDPVGTTAFTAPSGTPLNGIAAIYNDPNGDVIFGQYFSPIGGVHRWDRGTSTVEQIIDLNISANTGVVIPSRVTAITRYLPSDCPADFAASWGTLDIDDVLAYLRLFADAEPNADLAPPTGSFNVDDLLAFLAAFNDGC